VHNNSIIYEEKKHASPFVNNLNNFLSRPYVR